MITETFFIGTECSKYLQLAGADPRDCVFFDIETTGFRASSSHLYLIGAAYCSDSQWKGIQWLSERMQEETALLRVFEAFLRPFHTLVHFNGDRFDIPYLNAKYEEYQLASPLPSMQSLDIYHEVRDFRSLFSLSRMNQKTLETFLHIRREDQYDGGELIRVYHNFCRSGSKDLLRLLLLHNREDVTGMLSLVSLLSYRQLYELPDACPIHAEVSTKRSLIPESSASDSAEVFRANADPSVAGAAELSRTDADPSVAGAAELSRANADPSVAGAAELSRTDADLSVAGAADILPPDGSGADLLQDSPFFQITCDLPVPVPEPVSVSSEFCRLSCNGNALSMNVSIFCGKLRHYFPDYRSYYYLPSEDQAIHQSVAQFVDRAARQKARPDNCYIRREGEFLPQPLECFEPVFRRDYKDKIAFFELPENACSDTVFLYQYLRMMLHDLLNMSLSKLP